MTFAVTFLLLLFLAVFPFLPTEKIHHAVPQVKASIPEIPDTPVRGKFNGRTVVPETATLENGVLTLRQGKEFLPDLEVRICVPGVPKGAVPIGRSIAIKPEDRTQQLIFIIWREEGKETPETTSVWDGYTLNLSFAPKEAEGILRGKIHLSLRGKVDVELKGSFSAQIEGFRVINGEVDLTSDSNETLDEVALRYLKKKHGANSIHIDSQRDSFYARTLPDSRKWGHKDISYVVEGRRPIRTKLLFVKESNIWKIHQELPPNLIHQAHPVFAPDPVEHSDLITFAAAQRAEKDVAAQFPGTPVHGADIDYAFSNMSGFATADFAFNVDGVEKRLTKRYLLRLVGDYDWKVSRELGANEQVNLQTGKSAL